MSSLSTKEKVLSATTAIAAVVAVAAIAFHVATGVPADAAAKVNDSYISEAEVASDIASYRSLNSLTDNTDFATYLVTNGDTVSSFRQDFINSSALAMLVDSRAKELGVVPSDEDIQSQVDSAKSSYAFGDDSIWEQTLNQYGMSDADYHDQVKLNLEEQALFEKEVSRDEATDEDALTYAKNKLTGATQKHYYRIMIMGDDASSRAQTVYDSVNAAATDGSLSTEAFSELARQYSDEANVEGTGGSFAWEVEISDDTDLSEIIDGLEVGHFSYPNSVASDNDAREIIYCDSEYSFPSDSDAMAALSASDVPESLWTLVKEKASDSLWDANCTVYLNNLLGQAKITYYPVPDNAAYNVQMTAQASGSAASESEGSN